jgi:predicted secreted Zn-dependent protease
VTPHRVIAILLVCATLSASASAPALSIDHYAINGSTARELRADMNRLGPVSEEGVRNDGYTHWDIQWRYDYDRTAGACLATGIRVTLAVRMTLPRWTPPAGAPTSLIATWTQFENALRTHEDGHHALAKDAADEVRRVLHVNRRGSDCGPLGEKLDATAHAVLAELRRRQVRYDRETDFGRKQGVGVL